MDIRLKTLRISNFKGIKKMNIDLSERTDISGRNGTGKTSVYDAFTWVLFGKDSSDRKDFTVKPMNPDGSPVQNVEIEVEATLTIDGSITVLKRTQKERWVKKRGDENPEYQGNEQILSINDVPVQLKDFKKLIDEMFDEPQFRLLTSVYFFNALHWTERRKILVDLAGDVSDADIVAVEPDVAEVIESAEGKIYEYLKRIEAKRKKIVEEIESIPARIDELQRNTDDASLVEELRSVEARISELSQGEHLAARQQAAEQKAKIAELDAELASHLASFREAEEERQMDYRRDVQAYRLRVDERSQKIAQQRTVCANLSGKVEQLRDQWKRENERVFLGVCPTCKQAVDGIEDFNANKAKILRGIADEGQQANAKLKKAEAMLALLEADQIPEPAPLPPSTFDREAFIAQWKAKPEYHLTYVDELPDLQARSKILIAQMSGARTEARIQELKTMLREGNVQVAKIERQIHLIAKYSRVKMNMVEQKVSDRFEGVRFRMFNPLINGGEEPTCITMIEGVPYEDANHAGQINAGVSIINTLSEHYEKTCPLFIDNAEAVNKIRDTKCQLIRLIVSEKPSLHVINA